MRKNQNKRKGGSVDKEEKEGVERLGGMGSAKN